MFYLPYPTAGMPKKARLRFREGADRRREQQPFFREVERRTSIIQAFFAVLSFPSARVQLDGRRQP